MGDGLWDIWLGMGIGMGWNGRAGKNNIVGFSKGASYLV